MVNRRNKKPSEKKCGDFNVYLLQVDIKYLYQNRLNRLILEQTDI